MEARVISDFRFKTVMALVGHEYTKAEWRPVPAGLEQEAENHPFLEVRATLAPLETVPAEPILLASPAAVALAEQHGLDLATVTGTGAGGKVTLNDVKAAIPEG